MRLHTKVNLAGLALVAIAAFVIELRRTSGLDALPPDAANVIRYRKSAIALCEFDVPESGFRAWVVSQARPVMGPITRTGTTIPRYDPALKDFDLYRIPDALVSKWTGERADETRQMVYDFATHRAFFCHTSR